jgi:DNA-binding beta-propeller fold protein YncE
MGPSLWTSDLTVFAKQNPNGLGSHIDMLHQAPLCMGIAHEAQNAYWTFNGFANSIVRFDFGADHDVGTDDHSDGYVIQYVPGLVKYQAKVPSHLTYDSASGMLYIADTGNHRVARLNTKTGTRGKTLIAKEPLDDYYQMDNATLTTVVAEATGDVLLPSGIELHKGLLYVSDNERDTITAFTLEGQKVKQLTTGLPKGALSGIAFGPDGKLYFVDMIGNRVLRIDPRTNI